MFCRISELVQGPLCRFSERVRFAALRLQYRQALLQQRLRGLGLAFSLRSQRFDKLCFSHKPAGRWQ